MEDIIGMIRDLKEDKPGIVITDDLIEAYIQDNINLLIKEIKDEV